MLNDVRLVAHSIPLYPLPAATEAQSLPLRLHVDPLNVGIWDTAYHAMRHIWSPRLSLQMPSYDVESMVHLGPTFWRFAQTYFSRMEWPLWRAAAKGAAIVRLSSSSCSRLLRAPEDQ